MSPSVLKIFIDGKHIDDFSPGAVLQTVEVRQELNEHWWCDVVCRQTEDARFPIEDALGKDLDVKTVDEEGAERTLFHGFVQEAELEYEIYGSYTARLKGVDPTYKLDLTEAINYFENMGLADITKAIAGLPGIDAKVECEERDPLLPYFQWGETYWNFLKRLADDHKCWMRYHPADKQLQVLNAFQEGSTMQWRGEEGLRNFKIRGKLGHGHMIGSHYHRRPMESKVYQRHRQLPEFLDGSGPMVEAVKRETEKMPAGYITQRARSYRLEQYEALLNKECERAIGSKIVGHGESRNEELLPGNLVQIEGVLDAEGTYGLTKVVHRWTANGYMNEFWCTPWKQYTNPEPPKMQRWYGVVPARVVANDDPDHRGRVMVKFFWQEPNESPWLPMMTPHAGSDRGFYFIPEIGDEVLVAFEDGDVERPIVLGSMWNGVDMAPVEDFWGGEFKDNDCKRIVTKSGHRIQIVDKEGKEAIVVATPKHVRMAMMEKSDESGRSTLMLHSDGDIFISAGGRIHCKSAFFSREVG